MSETNTNTSTTEPAFRTRAERLTYETGHPETVTSVIETCERTYRDDLATDIRHLINELSVSQYGLTNDWLNMPNRSGEEAYALMMAFRAGLALGATTETPDQLESTTVDEQGVTIDE